MPNYFYNYFSTPDSGNPLFRVKMGAFAGYLVSFSGAAGLYALALLSGTKVPQCGVICVKWIASGAGLGATHAASTYMCSRARGNTDDWVNHMIGGAITGAVSGWAGSTSMRLHRAAGFAALSVLFKLYVQFIDQHPGFYVPRVGEHNPSPYISLNHRWMNKTAKKQEAELDEVL